MDFRGELWNAARLNCVYSAEIVEGDLGGKGPSPEADPEVGEDHGGSQETEI